MKQKKKYDKILMLSKSKLNSIEKLIPKALNDMEISHEEFIMTLNEKERYDKTKYKLRNDSKNEIMWYV